MTPSANVLDDSALMIQEIENNLEKSLIKRREEIERELQERIRREREESERRLSEIEIEIARERDTLKEYRSTISEFETVRVRLQAEIKDHLDKSIASQKDIERLTAKTLEELRQVEDLTGRLTALRDRTESKVTEIRNKLKEKYGVVTEPLDTHDAGDVVVNLEQELSKLKRIKELLENEAEPQPIVTAGNAVPAPSPAPARAVDPARIAEPVRMPESLRMPEPEPVAPPAISFVPPEMSLPEDAAFEKPQPEFKMPEFNQFIEDFVRRESANIGGGTQHEPIAARREEKREEKKAAAGEVNFQAIFELLEKNRRSESTDYNGEISFFQIGDRAILDGESLIRAISHIVDDSRKLYVKLGNTESPKDQFFLKQDLINHQEILRKTLLRGVKLYERDHCRLPQYTEDILNIGVLKDALDKLNLDNWSNEEEFRAFEAMTTRIKDAFYVKITPPTQYLKSIVEELED